MTGRAVVRKGSCPSVQNGGGGRCPGGQMSGRADVREGKCPFTNKLANPA